MPEIRVQEETLKIAPGEGKIPKDRSWAKIKLMMAKVDHFLDSLVSYEKENIPQSVLVALEPYLKDKDFDPDFVKSKSAAAAGLCSWVINIIKFYEVYCDVEPKRQALEDANKQLAETQTKRKVIITQVDKLEETLNDLTKQYKEAIEAKT